MVSAGTPVTCTVGATAYPLSAVNKLVKTLKIQGLVGHAAGTISIGNASLNTTTGAGVFTQLAIQTANVIEKFELTEVDAPNGINLADFYAASSNAGDIVIFSYNEQ